MNLSPADLESHQLTRCGSKNVNILITSPAYVVLHAHGYSQNAINKFLADNFFATMSLKADSSIISSSKYQVQLPSGLRLNVARKGDGAHAIVCVPAALATAQFSFAPQLQHFGREGSPFTIVAFDPRGYGDSTPPNRDFSIKPVHFLEQDAIDAHELMQQLGFKSYSVLGWCNGATAGMILAARQPQAISKLVIWRGVAYLTQEDIELYKTQIGSIDDWSPEYRGPLEKVYAGSKQDLRSLWSG